MESTTSCTTTADNIQEDDNEKTPTKDSRRKDAPEEDGSSIGNDDSQEDGEGQKLPSSGTSSSTRKRKRERSGHQHRWEVMYGRLVRFREQNGHCNVPNRYFEDPQLGSWVSAQRRAFKTITTGGTGSTAMTMERAQKLQQLGFHWRGSNPHNVPWETRYEELLDFIKRFGHPNIPMRWKENVQLSNWVSKQRHDYKLLERGTSSRLSTERLKLLNDVGFVWEVERCAESTQQRLAVLGQGTDQDGDGGGYEDGNASHLKVKTLVRTRVDPSGVNLSSSGRDSDSPSHHLSGTRLTPGFVAKADAAMMVSMTAAVRSGLPPSGSAPSAAIPNSAVGFLAALAGHADRLQQNQGHQVSEQKTRQSLVQTSETNSSRGLGNEAQRLPAGNGDRSGGAGGAEKGVPGKAAAQLQFLQQGELGEAVSADGQQQTYYMPILALVAATPGMGIGAGTEGVVPLALNLQSPWGAGASPTSAAATTSAGNSKGGPSNTASNAANPVLEALVAALRGGQNIAVAAAPVGAASGANNPWTSLVTALAESGASVANQNRDRPASGSTTSAQPQQLNNAIVNLLSGASAAGSPAPLFVAAPQAAQWTASQDQQGANTAAQNLISALASSIVGGGGGSTSDNVEQESQQEQQPAD